MKKVLIIPNHVFEEKRNSPLLFEIKKSFVSIISYKSESELERILPELLSKVAKNAIKNLFVFSDDTVFSFNISAKTRNVIAAVIENEYTAKITKEHNRANVLLFSTESETLGNVVKYIKLFSASKFAERHQIRVNMLNLEIS